MKKSLAQTRVLFISMSTLLLTASPAGALTFDNHCSFSFEHGVSVSPEQVRIHKERQVAYTFSTDGRLELEGESIPLTAGQRSAAETYSKELRVLVPELIDLIDDSMSVAADGVHAGLSQMFGEQSDMVVRIDKALNEAREHANRAMSKENDTYRINANVTDEMDEAFGPEFEKEIEELAQKSLWSVIKLLGRNMVSSRKPMLENEEKWSDDFDAEMFEAEMEARTEILEARGEALCTHMQEIDVLESVMQEQIPKLRDYDLLQVRRDRELKSVSR